jgi:chemosensory pili system protein ChpA (sensor histidine kinase/response regulator)
MDHPMNASPMSDDLSALAWVYEEVKKSLETAQKSLQRCLKESVTTGFSDVDAVDPAVLRNARQQLHQGVGALELAGLSGGATLLRASEALVQRYVNRPQSVNEEGVKAIEAASFALLDFMRRRLAGKPVSVMALFPPYETLTELAGGDMVRPSDLWVQEWPAVSLEVPLAAPSEAIAREAAVDAVDEFETSLLKLLRSGQAADAKPLVGLCADLSAGATARQAHRESATWVLACGFLQAIAEERLPITVHVKRVLSGLLSQLRTLAKGQALLSDRLTHELLFFCAQAQPAAHSQPGDVAPSVQGSVLDDLRQAFKLTTHAPVDLRKTSLGRFDPSWVTQAIKRVTQAKDGWSAVSANELLRLGGLNEQFSLVADSVRRLYPDGDALAQALQDTVASTVQSAQAPEPALAMEVATSLLYLDASLDEGEFDHPEERQRVQRLAERMLLVRGGHAPEPLESWMEALYRKVSDRQTMGSVVQELRQSLGECEKSIDQFFRDPTQTGALMAVASNLQSMKGVMGVLGLDAASQAVSRMRQDVEALQLPDADLAAAAEAGVHDRLASNLSAVGFLVDMLGVQPNLVKSLFAFNADSGVLAPIMGRAAQVSEPDVDPVEVIARPAEEQERQRAQEVAETLVSNLSRDDVPVLSLSEELQSLADSPLVLEQPDLAASVATAQEALGRATDSHDDASLQQARDDMSAALSDFVQSVSQPMELDALPEPQPSPSSFAPLVPEASVTQAETGLEEDDEMRGIFIEEAREVIGEARTGLADLHSQADDVSALTAIRRAFHTLKGSSRMVGLGDFGEAGWACEQLYNHWLASQAPASDDLLGLSREVLDHLADWVEDIFHHRDAGRSPQPVVQAADALRLEGRRQPVSSFEIHPEPEAVPQAEPAVETTAHARPDFAETPLSDLASGFELSPEFQPPEALVEVPQAPVDVPEVVEPSTVDLPELEHADFSDTQSSEHDVLDEPELSVDELPDLVLVDEAELEPGPTTDTSGAADAARVDLDLLSLDLKDLDGLAASPALEKAEQVPQPQALLHVVEPEAAAVAARPEDEPEATSDEQVKVIGDLRISIPLFNIFLNEADEQSRRLSTMLSEWAMELHRPVGDDVVALAHSLAGNSGAVGYKGLSGLSRHLEHALMKSQALGQGDTAVAELFNEAAEEVRRLLHQFAAGFLKSPSDELVSRLEHFDADALTRVDAQIVADDAAGRAHLRLVHSSEAEPEADLAQPPVAEEAVTELSMPDVDLSSGFADLPAPALAEPVNDPIVGVEPEAVQDTAAQPDPTAWPHNDQGDVSTLPMPLGLPELKPFEPMALDPLLNLRDLADHGDGVDLGEDADIEVLDAIDADLFPIFEEEAQELLPQLAADMRQWAEHPDRMDLATACMRTLHTFKGGARLAGAMRLGELAHRMESVVERVVVREAVTPQELESLQARTDILGDVFEALQRVDLTQVVSAETDAGRFAAHIETPAVGDVPPDTQAGDLLEQAQAPLVQAASDDLAVVSEPQAAEAASEHVSVLPIDWRSLGREFHPGTSLVTAEQHGGAMAMVRVRPRLLDRLVNHAGEVSITRTRLVSQLQQMRTSVGDLTENLERLRQQLRDIELQAETQLSTRMEAARAQQQQFDPLEFDRYTRFQELTRMMAESVNDVGTVQRGLVRNLETAEDQLAAQSRLTRDLQDDLLRTRMVEFEGLSDRLYRVVRQAAKETGKQARLDIVGGQTEVDRGVLDRMTGAFEHLLRNCVTHGIESPADREAAGKATMGAIVIAVRQDGNEVSIEFRDDGAGLNLDRIRRKAEALGLVQADAQPTEAELSQMIFQPGFSTAETVTELAGRGIGMDVVRSDVNAMGGRIETSTAAGQGTSFKLVLPLTTAVTKVVMVRCGELVASIPTNLIEIVRRTKAEEVEQAYASGQVGYADLTLPFFWFGALLQHSPRGVAEGRTLPVVIVRSAQQRVALHVDEVLGNQDVVVKNLGPQLSRVPGLAGMTLLASGAISLIYNPVALATVYGTQAQAWAQQARLAHQEGTQAPAGLAQPEQMAMPLVLVVDDSLTVRRVTQRLLTREGYRVTLAKDGLEALEKMAEETPAVVLSDIEMPKMDGFDLVRNLRGDARWRSIPVVMITSRIAQKHRDYAAELGVDHYLGKPYSEDELLSLVASYTRTPDITV